MDECSLNFWDGKPSDKEHSVRFVTDPDADPNLDSLLNIFFSIFPSRHRAF